MPLTTYNDVKKWVLRAADEHDDGSSDLEVEGSVHDALWEAWDDLLVQYPWLCFRKNPPGVVLTSAAITGLTMSVTAGLNAVATLSASQASSLVGWKVIQNGGQDVMRVTAHAAPSAQITLDAAPDTLVSAGVTLFKDEYDTASDLGLFVDGLWTQQADFIEVVPEKIIKEEYPSGFVSGWPPRYAARIGKTKIRFSSYPVNVERIEYPYNYEAAQPVDTPAVALTLDRHLRPAYAAMALALLMTMKSDTRAQGKLQLAQGRLDAALKYEDRLLRGVFGGQSRVKRRGPYA